ncbi:conserved hypothetical protein [Neospora caninum Liverpool]|uniref:Tetratricopeptide repeat-containing protein n=1 Tax=Neospora caninum (strain Liverpool) TaxID=572307 RepID=F0V7K3_NEOCL|nr:conserved hypothetical protein [Neospora caninum Liverpool]CBZ49694.1 conserved hypothetical protein [Neospora caninum Liverpool]CEL64279.1 TPA: hypothetical protein BN1204_001820 [Neospora caninum Liverpool]|eukprot:XP_003879729.1 conserved hypothetical protein [Neospora caninum Liverpool]
MRNPADFQLPPPPPCPTSSSGPPASLSGAPLPSGTPWRDCASADPSLVAQGEEVDERVARQREEETKAQVASLLLKRQFRSVLRLVSEALQQPDLPPHRLLQWVSIKIYALLSLKDAAGIEAELRALPHPLASSFWTYESHRHIYPDSDQTRGSLIPFCLHLFLAVAPSICRPSSPSALDAIYALLRFTRNQLRQFCHPSRCSCPSASRASSARESLLRRLAVPVSSRPPAAKGAREASAPGATRAVPLGMHAAAETRADESREQTTRDEQTIKQTLHSLWIERLTTVVFLAAEILVAKGHLQEALQLLQDEILSRRQQHRQHAPTLSLMGRISLRMCCLDLAEEFFGYVECLGERDSVATRTNNGLLALWNRDAGTAREAFDAGHALAEADAAERRKFFLGDTAAFEPNREEDVREGEQARQAAARPEWASKRLETVAFPSALASSAANLAVTLLYDKKLFEATAALESVMERQPEESLFVGGVRNLLTLYEFSFNKPTCVSYLSNLILTAASEDRELAALVAP